MTDTDKNTDADNNSDADQTSDASTAAESFAKLAMMPFDCMQQMCKMMMDMMPGMRAKGTSDTSEESCQNAMSPSAWIDMGRKMMEQMFDSAEQAMASMSCASEKKEEPSDDEAAEKTDS